MKRINMKILTINAGSSSLKYTLYDKEKSVLKGQVDAIGQERSKLLIKIDGVEIEKPIEVKDHKKALKIAFDSLKEYGNLSSLKEIDGVSHRVVHGGEYFSKATLIDAKVIKKIKELSSFAPLHNPHNLTGILECKKLLKCKQIAVFDTAFHQTIPEKAFLYALPYKFYEKGGIRKCGFHGTSHRYVSEEAKKLLKKEKCKTEKIITCHLGNGSSITAIKKGKSIDTSMGFTPLDGIPMGSRSGSIDPTIPLILASTNKPEEVDEILNKKSGFIGFTGISTDMRKIFETSKKGKGEKKKRADLMIEILSYKIAQYIGSYTTILGGLDGLVFTGGIGENAFYIRKKVCEYLNYLSLSLDNKKNDKNELIISDKRSRIRVYVIPTNEELQMIKESKTLLK
jgi:acetate kinase